MNADGIREVVRDVFGANEECKEINGWISLRCPISQWTHQRGADTNASAGISINDETSIFNCYSCKSKFPLHVLLEKYAEYTGEDLDGLIEELKDEAYLGPRELPDWGTLKQRAQLAPLVPISEEIYMDLYDSAAGQPYLRERGISDATATRLQLLFDPKNGSDNVSRILFPVRGPDGVLYGFSGRDTTGRSLLKVRDYHGLPKARCILGAHLHGEFDKILLCEGLFDYAVLQEMGFCGMAVMHSTLTQEQASILRDIGKPVYLLYDNDEAGQKGAGIAGKLLRDYVPTMKVRYPEVWIEDDSAEGGHYVKDPGELVWEEVDEMIKDCRLV